MNRMVCGMRLSGGEGWVWLGEVWFGWILDGVWLSLLSLVKSGLRRLCVVCATTETCCKCNTFIQKPPPG